MTIMQERPSAYTKYARKLCPSWCTETHDEPTDPRNLSAVHHQGPVGAVTTTDCYGNTKHVEVGLGQYDSLALNHPEDGHPKVTVWSYVPDELSPEDTVQIALLMIRAAETARRG